MSLTKSQEQAIAARGNVLVVAGAGTGKTKTLVDRCLSLLLDEARPVSIDEILMVTFTEAAAAEMRTRIRGRLEQEAPGPRRQRCLEQLALLDSAYIGTIHSFCYNLIRQHFYELEIDPQAAVMPKEEADLLAEETLDEVLSAHYSSKGAMADRVRNLVRIHGDGLDDSIRKAILRVHHYSQTLHNPAKWFQQQIEGFQNSAPSAWRSLLQESLPALRLEWTARLGRMPGNPAATACLAALESLPPGFNALDAAHALEGIAETCDTWPKGKTTVLIKPLEPFLEEVRFIGSLLQRNGNRDAIAQDWEWSRAPLLTLLEVSREFTEAFAKAKRDLGVLDFHDLEQHALRLLWDASKEEPTSIALGWRDKLKFVFVDEYQDINKAQDQIITALSRAAADSNRFLVGDAKQSIYRFRLASPEIFRGYAKSWQSPAGTTIQLAENFRSHESLIAIVNSVFGFLMAPEIGGIDYSTQQLGFGNPAGRQAVSRSSDASPRAELHLFVKDAEAAPEQDETDSSLAGLMDAEKEAGMVGLRLQELIDARQPVVWDEKLKELRPPCWGDIAILLRAPSNKAESYSKAFGMLGIPLQVARRGFYETSEISDLLSLLQVLDNPLQDLPLLAVLHSPIANLSVDELAEIRLASKKAQLWTALTLFCSSEGPTRNSSSRVKARAFLSRFNSWRKLARHAPVSTCLETVLSETHYCEWVMTQDRGPQRHGNVFGLVSLAREFDQFQRRGLLRFLSYLESQKVSDVEPSVMAAERSNAVTLMSIHQSKGLEFPIVVLADLAKAWNASELRDRFLLSDSHGLCSDVKPPHTRQRYPSLPLWLARKRTHHELLGEELRLLYVGMTRARDLLILSASTTGKKLDALWRTKPPFTTGIGLEAKSCADWLASWAGERGLLNTGNCGHDELITWRLWDDAALVLKPGAAAAPDAPAEKTSPGSALMQKLSWQYPHVSLTTEPAKSSVSALRRQANDTEDFSRGAHAWNPFATAGSGKLSGADRGSAHHEFLQHVSLEAPGDVGFLRHEATRLVESGILTEEQISVLDPEGIAAFWQSDPGKALLMNRDNLERELPFTARFSSAEVSALTGVAATTDYPDEFVVVQGVADLVAVLPGEIWLFDFKTDKVDLPELAAKTDLYRPQMKLYAAALEKTYGRPVTQSYLFFVTPRLAVSATSSTDPPPGTKKHASRAI